MHSAECSLRYSAPQPMFPLRRRHRLGQKDSMRSQDASHTTTPASGQENLHARSGLPLSADEAALELRFGPGLIGPEPIRRYATELQPVLLAPAPENDLISTIYRGVAPEEAAEEIRKRG